MLIFHVEKFAYKRTHGTKNRQSTFRRETNARDQDSEAWRSSKHLAAFEDTEIWDGEELVCAREPHNSHDRYAVAVKREDVLYLPLYCIDKFCLDKSIFQ